jgi:hypothetical protein
MMIVIFLCCGSERETNRSQEHSMALDVLFHSGFLHLSVYFYLQSRGSRTTSSLLLNLINISKILPRTNVAICNDRLSDLIIIFMIIVWIRDR